MTDLDKDAVYAVIEQHYRDNHKRLVKVFMGPAGNVPNAEDVIQEGYTRACKYWKSFNINKDVDTWLYSIMSNCLKDKIKDERQHGASEDEEECHSHHKAFNNLIIRDVIAIIEQQEGNIPTILKLYFFEQYTTKEISEVVTESHNLVRQIIHRFRKQVRNDLNERLFE